MNLTIDEQGHPEDQFGQRNQPYDGEADPVLIIRANNEKRVFEQHGLVWPSPPVVPNLTLFAGVPTYPPHTSGGR